MRKIKKTESDVSPKNSATTAAAVKAATATIKPKVLITCRFKFWVTTFWFLQNIKHHNHATFMNQKVVTQNFIIEPTLKDH